MGLTQLGCIVVSWSGLVWPFSIVLIGGGVTKGHMTLVLDWERWEEGSWSTKVKFQIAERLIILTNCGGQQGRAVITHNVAFIMVIINFNYHLVLLPRFFYIIAYV